MSNKLIKEMIDKNFTGVDKAIYNMKILIPYLEAYAEVIKHIEEECKELEKQQMIDFTNDFIDKHTIGDYDGIVQVLKPIEQYYKETYLQ